MQAQEKIVRDSLSTVKPQVELNGLMLEMPFIQDHSFSKTGAISGLEPSMFNMPLIPDRSRNFDDYIKYSNNKGLTTSSFAANRYFWSPFLQNGTTFNQATYRLNDRFSFGGSSFGAQSIFDLPKMNSDIQNMSIKGASMYLQYKVSDHFKIEGRVGVSGYSSPPAP
jgi:hypothetical protein